MGNNRGSGRGAPDPAFLLLFHEKPASHTVFRHYPESHFFKRCRLALSIDILNLHVFLKVPAKTEILFHISI